jgi:hypothetical protein
MALRQEVLSYKPVVMGAKKQKKTGAWGDGMLGNGVFRSPTAKDVGTIAEYRFLVDLGVPLDDRSMRMAERIFFRLLSRDEDPLLLFEFAKAAKGNPELVLWTRGLMRQGATAALAQAGHLEDPRVRGAAHRVADEMSAFLRSELAEKPLIRKGARTILHPEANPPTLLSVAMFAYMPSLQRERAGFVERLGQFLAQPQSKRAWVIQAGKRALKPTVELLGDPLVADAQGRTKDLPLALHWIELLVRMGQLQSSPTAPRVLARLLSECDSNGVWNPPNLRTIPKGTSHFADFSFPLEVDGKSPESRKADVTFRLALIAKLAGWTLEYT